MDHNNERNPRLMTRRFIITGLIGILGAAAALYFWTHTTTKPDKVMTLDQATIALTNYAGSGLALVAVHQGLFAQAGVDMKWQSVAVGKAGLEMVLSGKIDFATVSDIPIMFAAQAGRPVAIVATIFKASNDHGIVGRKDRGIDGPASLRGKRIAVTPGTSGHFFLDTLLLRNRIPIDNVAVQETSPADMADALTRGTVDAVATWEPNLGTAQVAADTNGVRISADGIYEVAFNIVTTRDYATRHPETVRRVVQALLQAETFVDAQPEASRQVLATVLKLNPADLARLWPDYQFNVSLDQSLLIALEDESRWAIKHALSKKSTPVNYLDHLYIDALTAVKPSAVSVIH